MHPANPNRRNLPLKRIPFLPGLLGLMGCVSLMFWACQLTQSGQTTKTLSFTSMYDSLKQFDDVIIVVKDAGSGAEDTIFNGKVDAKSKIQNLESAHYSGKDANIIITGFNAGKLMFKVDKSFDGATGSTKSDDTLVVPTSAVTAESATLQLREGDTAALPKVTVAPAGLADKTLSWSSSQASILSVSGDKLIAKSVGTAELTAKLNADPARQAVIEVTVVAKGTDPSQTAPNAPLIGSVSPGDAKVVLAWAPVSGADEYNLYYGEGGAVDKNSTRVKKITSPYEVKSLKNGAAYGFALSAVNAYGESGLSPIKTAMPQVPSVSAPAFDSITAGNGKVTLHWSALPEALGYVLYYKAGATVDKSGTRITSITSPYDVTGLTNGSQYSFALTALKSDGETGLSNIATASPQAPSVTGLSYAANPAVYWKGVPIAVNAAQITGAVDSFTVSPALPDGLTLNKTTGEIAGTPTAAAANANYTIKAKNSGGTATAILAITVNAPPSSFTYKDNPAVYWQSVESTTNSATITGVIDSFTVSPALPAGLVLSKTTGAISGTPSVIATSAKYVVTARNPAGSASVAVTILVNGPPSGFYFASNPAVYSQGVAIAPNTATISGAVDIFSVSPPLPAGLVMNTATGTITGTPTAASALATYSVTAKNAAGSPTITLTLTVNGPPTALAYTTASATYWQSVAIAQNTATVSGAVDSFTVSPALPAGLALNKATGAITGTPIAAAASAVYTVTAKNGAGSTTKAVTILVNAPPTGLSYAANPASYIKSTAITANAATVSGLVDSFTVAPALPAGLSLDKATGAITGTPTVIAGAAVYVVTAKNPAGSATASLNITVSTSPVGGLSYSSNPAIYWKGVALTGATQNTPTVSGGANDFTVAPALPAGLSLDKTTGVITGTPTTETALAVYIVTAKNPSGGSASANLTVTVNGPPTALSYGSNPAVYWKGVAITDNLPTVTGVIESYTISPALPTGLSFNTATGKISGTATVASAATNYTITAVNKAGSAPVTLSLAVNGPPAITYPVQSANYPINVDIAPNTPAFAAGTVTGFAIAPALPNGLVLNATTGTISGKPLASTGSPVSYVVTATNPAGTGKDTLLLATVTGGSIVTIPVNKDIGLDTGNASGWDVGYAGFGWFRKYQSTENDFHAFFQYDLSHVVASGITSAKVIFKTFAYMNPNTFWDGSYKTIKAHVYSLNNSWVEGTGNWYYHDGAWSNNGQTLYGTYGLSDALKAASTNPSIPTGLLYTDHAIVRAGNITEQGPARDISVNYGAANTHTSFTVPLPPADKLMELEVDVTDYVKAKAGTTGENGILIMLEGLPANAQIGVLFKEIGDGSYGSRIEITY